MDGEKKLTSPLEVTKEFLNIFKDGLTNRVTDGKNKVLRYGVLELRSFFHDNNMELGEEKNFINRCNAIICSDENYKILNKVTIVDKNGLYYIANIK